MAKANKSAAESKKIIFGKKKKGKAKRAFGPKESAPKKYRGQGK